MVGVTFSSEQSIFMGRDPGRTHGPTAHVQYTLGMDHSSYMDCSDEKVTHMVVGTFDTYIILR